MNEDTNRLDYPERELSDAEVFENAMRDFDDEPFDDLYCVDDGYNKYMLEENE